MSDALAEHWRLVDGLADRFEHELTSVLAPGEPVVLMDLPLYANVGDHAILLGELAALKRLGHRVHYVPAIVPFDTDRVRAGIGRQMILLHGGGNLGDLWPTHQMLREQIIRDFPGNRIVQLPQSLSFSDAAAVDRARTIMSAHGGLTVFVRDRASEATARDHLGLHPVLCPDAAFALRRLERPRPPAGSCVILARTDHESAVLPSENLHTTDWLDGYQRPVRLAGGAARRLERGYGRWSGADGLLAAVSLRAWTFVAQQNVERGRRLLGAGETVVCDRLHAHILCMLMGIPHVIVDNISRKVTGFAQTWTGESALVGVAESFSDGAEKVRSLALALALAAR